MTDTRFSKTNGLPTQNLMREGGDWKFLTQQGVTSLKYTFSPEAPTGFNQIGLGDFARFSPFTTLQKTQVKSALQWWADAAKVTFDEVLASKDAHLTFGGFVSEHILIDSLPYYGNNKVEFWQRDVSRPGSASQYEQGMLGKTGKLLGLKLPSGFDKSMSSKDNVVIDGDKHPGAVAQVQGITAIQQLYGRNHETRSGDTTYGFNSNAGRDYFAAENSLSKLVFAVWDGGGTDTFDFSGYKQDQLIDLNDETYSNIGGMTGNVAILCGVVVENAVGGSGDDVILGNNVANIILGGDGKDYIKGGGGSDILKGGNDADSLFGGAGADELHGEAGSDELEGDNGNDRLFGGEGDDKLWGGEGDDLLLGNEGNDRLYGGMGDDTLRGGKGNDILHGNEGNDTLRGGKGDDLLQGNEGNDLLSGGKGKDTLWGNEGNDTLRGGEGSDTLWGGKGDDILQGGRGADILLGEEGTDRFVYTSLSDSTVTAADAIGGFKGGEDKIDLSAIRNAIKLPMKFVDKFSGHAGDMVLSFDEVTNEGRLTIDADGDANADFLVTIIGQISVNDILI